MAREYRIRVRGKQRKDADATLVAQAIVLLGRELWRRADEQAKQQATKEGEQPVKAEQSEPES